MYFESDENEELTIDFKQWTTTDRTDLLTMKLLLNEFIELMNLYLKHLKEILSPDEAIVSGDFAENYNFVVCHHDEDFSISCIWTFFATSHGKSPCDRIGGTVKRLVATASLQKPVSNQILSAEAMFKSCQQSINAIKFVNVTVEEME